MPQSPKVPDHRSGLLCFARKIPSFWGRTLAALDATETTQVSDFQWKKLPRILHGTLRRGVERDVRGQLRALKSVLEQS